MALVKRLPPVEREVPHEPGNFFSFRRLTADEMDEAEAAAVKETVDRYGADTMKALSGMDVPGQARQVQQDNPLAGHSPKALVKYGLVGWRGPDYPSDAFSEETVSELDAETRKWAALQVLDISAINEGEARSFGGGTGTNGTEPTRRSVSETSGSPS